ncbi:amidohydrolase family protein [Rubellimicrobium roseum]|nr:amidohydrolase family protein [Rubellimicrobium roseum]
MKRTSRMTICLGAALLGATAALAQEELLLTDVQIVDVAAGTVTPGQDLLIHNGTIAELGENLAAPEGAEVFDAMGAFAIPGLWDMHVHVFSSPTEPDTAFDMYLLNGVTGIRDMGGLLSLEEQRRIAAQVEDGTRRGPRVIPSGAWVDAPPGSWPGMYLAATPGEARSRVREIAALGWPAVKSYSMLASGTYRALAAEAEAIGLPLVGHIPEAVTLGEAIAAGQNGMEHWGRVTMACSTAEAELVAIVQEALASADPRSALIAAMQGHNARVLETWDEALCRDTMSAMAGAGLAVSPTLVVADFYVGARPGPDALRMRVLTPEVRAAWEQSDFRLEAITDEICAIADQSIALDHRTFLMAHEAGVPILASTDASYANPWIFHGFSLLDELDRYVEIGLTPQEALYTATVAPPVFLELLDQDGTLASGRRADIVLLAANPFEGLATLREPVAVIAKGRLIDREALDAMTETLVGQGG